MPYKHGAYGDIVPSQDTLPPSGVGTLPVYIGTAPVQMLADYSEAINKPILVNSFNDAKAKIGYSDDWDKFSLCEAVYAHFKNDIQNIGPIVLINVMDPATHKVSGTASVTLTNNKGYIDEPIILDSVNVDSKVKGTDYTVEYTEDGRVLFTAKTAITSPVTVSYDKMDRTVVADNDIIGGIDADTGARTGLACIDLINQEFGMIPTIIAAPGFSQDVDIYSALVAKCQKINGHWDAICVVDIDCSTSGAKTISAAIDLKATNVFTSKFAKPCWPMEKVGEKIFHLSTMAVVRMQQTDFENDNTPYVSPSNKQIMCTGTVLADGTAIQFDELQANSLNAEGITTANYSGGQWRLWGPHMGNYKYGTDVALGEKFDSDIRMMQWLTNSFQQKYLTDIDGPLNRRKVESILDDSQIWLNGLVNEGKLLFGEFKFLETSNQVADMVEGDFVFDGAATTTPPGKSITFNIQYTAKGLNTLFGGEQ